MRMIDTIAVHCAYTKPSQDIGAAEIREWHKEEGWLDIGYHFVIRRNGGLELGRPVSEVGAHVKGHNQTSIGICLVGGKSETGNRADFNYSEAQMNVLWALCLGYKSAFNIPDSRILGHRDFPGVLKECPCFDVQEWWRNRQEGGF